MSKPRLSSGCELGGIMTGECPLFSKAVIPAWTAQWLLCAKSGHSLTE